jgi:hypothetical protein
VVGEAVLTAVDKVVNRVVEPLDEVVDGVDGTANST